MQNYANGPEIPMGFGMALAENMPAMEYFSSLSHEKQQAVIAHTHQIRSKREMQAYVRSLVEQPPSFY